MCRIKIVILQLRKFYNIAFMAIIDIKHYVAPELLMVEYRVERGFANTLEDPSVNPEIDW